MTASIPSPAMSADDVATAKLEAALALHRELGDPCGAAHASFMLGHAFAAEGDLPRAQLLYEESVRVFRDGGDEHLALLASRHLAFAYERLGDRERARALHEDNFLQARATRNGRIEATALGALAEYALHEGRVHDATALLTESLRIHQELRDLLDTAVDLSRFARVLAHEGRAETAVQLVSSLEAVGGEIGARRGQVARTDGEDERRDAHSGPRPARRSCLRGRMRGRRGPDGRRRSRACARSSHVSELRRPFGAVMTDACSNPSPVALIAGEVAAALRPTQRAGETVRIPAACATRLGG